MPRQERLSLYKSLTESKRPRQTFVAEQHQVYFAPEHILVAESPNNDMALELSLALNLAVHDWNERCKEAP